MGEFGRLGRVLGMAAAVVGFGLPAVLTVGAGRGAPSPRPADAAGEAAARASLAQAPLSFEPNVGQAEPGTAFVARGLGHSLSLTSDEATLGIAGSAVRMRMVGADPAARVAGRHELEGRINYFVGNDPAKWRSDVPTYAQVVHERVWPGVDLVWHQARSDAVEYDFVVAPGASPNDIAVRFDGATGLRLDHGELVVATESGELVQHAPLLYQDTGGKRVTVPGRFVLDGDTVRFSVGAYDATRPLVIDPVLAWSTYLGGNVSPYGAEAANDIAVDATGAAYVTGQTCSTSFPKTTYAYQKVLKGSCDAIVTKFSLAVNSGAGTGLKYSTFLGGNGSEQGKGIALDAVNNAYVVGETFSANFPLSAGANATGSTFVTVLNPKGTLLKYSARFVGGAASALALGPALPATPTQPTVYLAGGDSGEVGPTPTPDAFQSTCNLNGSGACTDVWAARVNPVGSGAADLVWATYLGGSGIEQLPGTLGGGSLAVDGTGRAYIAGDRTESTDFPITANAFDVTTDQSPTCNGAVPGFVAVLDPSLPGDGTGVPSATNPQLVWSTYFDESSPQGIAVGPGDTVYLTGNAGRDFPCGAPYPTTEGAFDTIRRCPGRWCTGMFAKFDPSLPTDGSGVPSATNQQLVYSTYLGDGSMGGDVAVDSAGRAWIAGATQDATFPKKDPVQSTCGCFYRAGNADGFVAGIDPAGNGAADLVFGTYLGGTHPDWLAGIALGAPGSGAVYVAGTSYSYKNSDGHGAIDRYPVTANTFQSNNKGEKTCGGCGSYPDAVVSKISGLAV